jgi:hypothetical protein
MIHVDLAPKGAKAYSRGRQPTGCGTPGLNPEGATFGLTAAAYAAPPGLIGMTR